MKKLYTLMVCLLATSVLFAQKLPFQGRLLDGGKPYNGTATIEFSISDPAWSETKNNVSVTDGYYSVILGETTPLPQLPDEVALSITIDGEALSDVTIYNPTTPYTMGGPVQIDSIEGSFIKLLNAAGNEGVYLRGTTEGGSIQLSSPDATNTFNRALFFAGVTSNGENAYANLYGMNPTADGNSILINNYNTINSVFGTPFSNGYRRGGTDYYDNEGTFLAGIGSNRDESGGDPSGKSGLVILNGPVTRNVYASGQWWANSELGIVQVFGQNDNGSGDWSTNVEIVADDQSGESSGRISMMNTADGGTVNETILISSNNGSGHGFIDIRDSGGATQFNYDAGSQTLSLSGGNINLDGATGNINAIGTVSSDRRLKKDIQQIDNSLEKTLKMRGVSYHLKDPKRSERKHIGVIAQEVEEIYPEFVHTDDQGMKAVNYAQMTAVLIEAIKELNDKVKNLEEENSSLKASLSEVEILRKEMDLLMKMLGNSKAASK